jgi:PAS domain S-box-containing protein
MTASENTNSQTPHELFLDSILDNIPDMVFVKDAEHLRFVLFNKAGEELVGRKKEELIGKSDYDFFPKEEADFFTQKDRAVLNGKILIDIPEEPIHTATRGVRILHTKKIPLSDSSGTPRFLVGISEDITERKRVEEDLQASVKELEAFSYSVSHDLRAPLRAIEGFAQILWEENSKPLDEEGKRLVSLIRKNGFLLAQLVDDLLAFARVARKDFAKHRVPMGDLARLVSEELRREKGIAADIFQIQSLPDTEGDTALLRQVWLNVISNALKFTRKTASPRIEIGSEDQEKEVIYFVRDNGVGFDMQFADKLFSPFQRLHSALEFEGSGIGLAMVQRIIHKHGGRVWAEGQVDAGATLYFALPKSQHAGS